MPTIATEQPKAKNVDHTDKPVSRVQYGNVSVAVFPRDVTKGDGSTFTAYDFSLRRSFKKSDGEWDHVSISLNRSEAMKAAEALRDCFRESYRLSDQAATEDE